MTCGRGVLPPSVYLFTSRVAQKVPGCPVGRRNQWTNWKHENFSEYVPYAYDVDAMLCPLHWVRLRYARVSELYAAAIRSQNTENDNLYNHVFLPIPPFICPFALPNKGKSYLSLPKIKLFPKRV